MEEHAPDVGITNVRKELETTAGPATERTMAARSAAVMAMDTQASAASSAMGTVTPVRTPTRTVVDPPVHAPMLQLVGLVAVNDRSKATGYISWWGQRKARHWWTWPVQNRRRFQTS
jgi:hypothetical protein